jgi:MFS transporter, DHA1 family, multidrug resistance protein
LDLTANFKIFLTVYKAEIKITYMKIDYKYLLLIFAFPFVSLIDRFMYPFFNMQGITYLQIGIIDAFYSAFSLVTLYYLGHVSDRIGRRKSFAMFLLWYLPFPLIYLKVTNFFQGIFVRIVQTPSCSMYPVESAYEQDLAHSVNNKSKATFFGILSAVSGIGYFLYPMLGGFIVESYGFFALGVVTSLIILSVILLILALPEPSRTRNSKIKDKINFKILRKNRFLKAFSIYSLLTGVSFVITFIWIPLFALEATGSYSAVGFLISSTSFFMILGRIPFGYLADRYGRERIFLISGIIYPISLVLLAFSNNITAMVLSSLISSLASSMMLPAQGAMFSKFIDPKIRGGVFNALTFLFTVGIVVGGLLGGLLTTFFSISSAFLFAALVNFVAISVFVYVLKK